MNKLSSPTVCEMQTEELVERIETNVRRRLGGMVLDFQVQVQDQGMVLQGRTHTYYAKQLVQHMALMVGGLPLLANDIEVL